VRDTLFAAAERRRAIVPPPPAPPFDHDDTDTDTDGRDCVYEDLKGAVLSSGLVENVDDWGFYNCSHSHQSDLFGLAAPDADIMPALSSAPGYTKFRIYACIPEHIGKGLEGDCHLQPDALEYCTRPACGEITFSPPSPVLGADLGVTLGCSISGVSCRQFQGGEGDGTIYCEQSPYGTRNGGQIRNLGVSETGASPFAAEIFEEDPSFSVNIERFAVAMRLRALRRDTVKHRDEKTEEEKTEEEEWKRDNHLDGENDGPTFDCCGVVGDEDTE